ATDGDDGSRQPVQPRAPDLDAVVDERARRAIPAGAVMELPILVLAGPTGAGKTDWAIRLTGEAPVEIVSVDSALVYRGMDIGTAKPPREVRDRIPPHLIKFCAPTKSSSAGRFIADALEQIKAAHNRRRVPLLVG